MNKRLQHLALVLLGVLCLVRPAWAELTIEITQGVDNPTRIAAVPFGWQGSGVLPEDIAAIVSADLSRSGQFQAMDQRNMMSLPSRAEHVYYRDWRILNQEFLLIGRITPGDSGGYRVHYELFDVYKQTRVVEGDINAGRNQLRDAAHLISDRIYERLTGIKGAFSTRIAYVTVDRSNGADRFRLQVADADGHREKTVRDSAEPILSPHWSPDGDKLAYVSFEGRRPGVYIQDVRTGQRDKVPFFKGLNSAPAWSPDGRRLAMVLSKDGNPEIYIYDIASRQFTRVTRHFGIDTEPSWSADGRSLVFTSSRGGKPQIYRQDLATGRVERLTFEGDYNARGRLSADGRYLVMVHRQQGVFHIAVKDLKRDRLRILTQTQLDESPSIAPNGSMIIYATNYRGKGILASVSLDGRVKSRLPSKFGDVREPAWSPN
ncbi:MAG: Tol-Pal system beta propeller repeat protein TolB [Pseudomonadales bacterium]